MSYGGGKGEGAREAHNDGDGPGAVAAVRRFSGEGCLSFLRPQDTVAFMFCFCFVCRALFPPPPRPPLSPYPLPLSPSHHETYIALQVACAKNNAPVKCQPSDVHAHSRGLNKCTAVSKCTQHATRLPLDRRAALAGAVARIPLSLSLFFLEQVEKMIGDLGQMFSRFSTMVAAQEEVVMHIEDDVEAAHTFAEEGQAHLSK